MSIVSCGVSYFGVGIKMIRKIIEILNLLRLWQQRMSNELCTHVIYGLYAYLGHLPSCEKKIKASLFYVEIK